MMNCPCLLTLSVVLITVGYYYLYCVERKDKDYFKDATVLLTGASSGIGNSFAMHLANPECGVKRLIIVGRNMEKLETNVVKVVSSMNKNIEIIPLVIDLSKTQEAIDAIAPYKDSIDVYINNAGLTMRGLFRDMVYPSCEYIMNTNTMTPIAICSSIINGMDRRESGLIINILSVAGLMPVPERTMYSASKWALTGFMRVLRSEQEECGVRVINAYPSYVRTNIGTNAMMGNGERFGKLDKNIAKGMHPDEVVRRCFEGLKYGNDEIVIAPLYLRIIVVLCSCSTFISDIILRQTLKQQKVTREIAAVQEKTI